MSRKPKTLLLKAVHIRQPVFSVFYIKELYHEILKIERIISISLIVMNNSLKYQAITINILI